MTRILADLPDDDIKWLDQLAAEQGKSRAAVLREAVEGYKPDSSGNDTSWIDKGFGLLDMVAGKYPKPTLNEASGI